MGLPCATCHADCCGPVPLSASRLAIIKRHLSAIPDSDYEALRSQKRPVLTCAFVDTRNWSCAVYPVRPALCDLYGRVEALKCPHHPVLVNIVTQDTADMRIALECNRGIVAMSNEYVYETRMEGVNES